MKLNFEKRVSRKMAEMSGPVKPSHDPSKAISIASASSEEIKEEITG